MTPIYFYKTKSLSNLKPSSLVAVKADGETTFSLYITDKTGIPYPIKDNEGGGGGGILSITNTDSNLEITGVSNKVINISPSILSLINSALQNGDTTSELINNGSDGTSTYVEVDELGVVAFSNDYNDLNNKPTIPTVITNHSELTLDDGTNPHGTTKNDVGLGNVPNLDTTDAVNNSHTHSNKSILDLITEPFTTSLKSLYDGAVTSINNLLLTGQRLITSSEITKLNNTSGTNTGDETTLSIQTKRPLKTINGESLEGVGNIEIEGSTLVKEKFTFSGSQSFTLGNVPSNIFYITVQGQVLDITQFSISGTTLTILDTLNSGDIVNVAYNLEGVLNYVPTLEQVLNEGTLLKPRFLNDTGWAQYTDTIRTVSAPFTINSGATATLPCNGATTIKTQMPKDFTEMFDVATNKLIGVHVDDKFLLNVRFKAKTSVVNDFFSIGINIGAGATVGTEDYVFTRGANTEQQFSIKIPYFTRSTFVANGGLIQITARNGNLQIYDITIIPELTHKAF